MNLLDIPKWKISVEVYAETEDEAWKEVNEMVEAALLNKATVKNTFIIEEIK